MPRYAVLTPDRLFFGGLCFLQKTGNDMNNSIFIKGVKFERTTPKAIRKDISSNILFFMISQSGAIDRRGTIYFFTPSVAYFMEREDYTDEFTDELFLFASEWNLVNAYFCDFLIIRPDIYDSFVRELCARNQPYFWFDTAIEVYGNKYCD